MYEGGSVEDGGWRVKGLFHDFWHACVSRRDDGAIKRVQVDLQRPHADTTTTTTRREEGGWRREEGSTHLVVLEEEGD